MTLAQALAAAGLEPREARLLLAAAAGLPEASVLAHPQRPLSPEAERRFAAFAERRRAGEPVAYLLGRKEFYGLELEVDAAVLIPRPETELLVELALARPFASVLDLGTGSGAIALALKRHRPHARVVAVDSSAAALALARRNAQRLGLQVELRQGHWLQAASGERYEAIVSNPPYVAMGDPHLPALRHEPPAALLGGADGLDAIREIAACAPGHLAPGGSLLLEHGLGQAPAVRALLRQAGFAHARTWPDLAGIARVTVATVE
ncbi:MAG TPA: peptide chain release factor N(5)-glutamine methyltransferase [Burkholderiales bacterium]|nr:peptide chain release factor N(5)-glutamine methyltransferase [Burkholderiales bacterium]